MATVTVNLGDKEVKEAITEWVAKHLNMKVKGEIKVSCHAGGDMREPYPPSCSAAAPAEMMTITGGGYFDR